MSDTPPVTPRMTRRQLHALAGAWIVGLATRSSHAADAANASGKSFDASLQVGKSKLQLNGYGTRRKAYFHMYDLALYTASAVSTTEQAIVLPGPKVLSFISRQELPGGTLGRLFVKGMEQNATPDTMQRHYKDIARLIEVFSGKPKLLPGDTFAMEYDPGKGTTFYITGQPQGEPVGDAEFFEMALRIWLGNTPADEPLKRALLGQR